MLHKIEMTVVDLNAIVLAPEADLGIKKTIKTEIINLILATAKIKIIMWMNDINQDLIPNLQASNKTYMGILVKI